jgi:pyruvate dehydrogenase E1 component alpha subunit
LNRERKFMDNELLRWIFETALLCRRFEARVMRLAMAGEILGSLHPGAGQEVEQVSALAALAPDDFVLYGHRGVGYMIARGTSLAGILADIAGREGATSRGKGGVMHVVDVAHGVLGESGTVGGGFVVSVGVGMALQRRGKGQVVVHFFGDGTSNRGTFHESLNWAAVLRLPCIYICENNGLAASVPTNVSTSVQNVADRAHGYGIPGEVVDGNEPESVFQAVLAAVERARGGGGPSLIEAKVTRLLGHFMGDQQSYRDDADEVGQLDPLPRLQARLLETGIINDLELKEVDADIDRRVEEAVAAVRAAPPLTAELAQEDLYA